MESNKQELMTIKQVALYLKLSQSTIDRMLADGEFVQPDYTVSAVKKRLWKQETIDNFLETNCRNPKSLPAA